MFYWEQYQKTPLFLCGFFSMSMRTFTFFHRIISSLCPWHTSTNSPQSFGKSYYDTFFFKGFDHILATTGNMFTIGSTIHPFCPEAVIGGKILLIASHKKNQESFYHANFLKNSVISGLRRAVRVSDFFLLG